ncbi:ATP-binding protein [Sphaerisporangium sp. TRM90804]|uniref:ATP-binding protein n=1 Tax=Sphaerisporangium sp. TRM90804 TaxID=3031113 RepID=UPI00244A407E|nr:ATP-binding protein [Sphaerisporangium sp. TRM90804]MDH2427562.1 ATP-binding protein [Sphaerisporangium sp. TRM90804]
MATDRLSGSLELIGTVASVPVARAFVRGRLGSGHPALDDVMLLATELTANAVLHSGSRHGGPIWVTLSESDHAIRVSVRDTGSPDRPYVSGDLWSEGGRGLLLVEEISQRWGVTDDQAGRTVWCEVKF